ncbi:MAG: type IV secretory system conjugative DNA transfer family protein [Succinivibrio sp.]|nr:type IV secretory system conjugative DNA transfer family protein [Succinivibrio sp.]
MEDDELLLGWRGALLKALGVVVLTGVIFLSVGYLASFLMLDLAGIDTDKTGVFSFLDFLWFKKTAYFHKLQVWVRLQYFSLFILPFAAAGMVLALLTAVHVTGRKLHGQARFARVSEIRKMGLLGSARSTKACGSAKGQVAEYGILVGKVKAGGKERFLSYRGKQFVMLAAPTRSGKGVGMVIPNCLNYEGSLVVLDIKLENFTITAGWRKRMGQQVYLFAPFDREGRTHKYNPLSYVSANPVERVGEVDAIGAALYQSRPGEDNFWDQQAKDLFRGICLMVLETPGIPHTLGEVFRQGSGYGQSPRRYLKSQLAKGPGKGQRYSGICVDSLNRILGLSENTFSSILATFNTPLNVLADPRVDAAMSGNDFDLRDLRRKKMSVYVGISPDKLRQASVIVNLFFDQLINLNTKVLPEQDPSLKEQCLMIMDEFTALGPVNMIKSAVAYQAGYNLRLMTVIQNKSQLKEVYGQEGAVTLMANHALMVIYAPSPVILQDAVEYSEMLGYQTVKGIGRNKRYLQRASRNESEQRRALLLPQEIRELPGDKQILALEHQKPVYAQKICYYRDKYFKGKCNLSVPKIPQVDVQGHYAQTQALTREITREDLNDEAFADQIVGAQELRKWEDVQDLRPEEIAQEVAEKVFNLEEQGCNEGDAANFMALEYGGMDELVVKTTPQQEEAAGDTELAPQEQSDFLKKHPYKRVPRKKAG